MIALMFAAAVAASSPTVHDLAWMAGDRTEAKAVVSHEVWIDAGDTLLGVSASVKNGHATEYEHLRIGALPDGRLAYFAMPSGQKPAVFPLKSYGGGKVVFEDPTHDFPQRIIYENKGNGVVAARIEGTIGGKARAMDWTFSPRH